MNKPNILIFMTDQQRACSVLPDDAYKAKTPVLDEFREESVTFSRAFCPSPHCCPSRASFMPSVFSIYMKAWHSHYQTPSTIQWTTNRPSTAAPATALLS